MAKVILVQYWFTDHLGLMNISAFLRQNGHESSIMIRHEEKSFIDSTVTLKPDIVGFSCTTGLHLYALEDMRALKQKIPDVITVMGGPHPTFAPEIIGEQHLDIVCRGEGEGAMLELCNRVDNKSCYGDVQNFWVKINSKIYKNEVRPLIEDLDTIPFADRRHYRRYAVIEKMPRRFVNTGRGCHYSCSFCYSSSMRQLYKGKGSYVRQRSIEHILREIEAMKQQYSVGSISFEDDTFLYDKEWTKEFLFAYKKRINISYICDTRFDTITEDIVMLLKDTGCFLVSFGLESGNNRVREYILNKRLDEKQILDTARMFKKYNLRFRTYNIVGIPGETTEEAMETVVLNSKIKADFVLVSFFQPYPSAPLTTQLISKGLLKQDFYNLPMSFWSKSIIRQSNIQELENLQKLFYFLVKIPILQRVAPKLIRINLLSPIYALLYKLAYLFSTAKSYKLNLFKIINYAFRMRKFY